MNLILQRLWALCLLRCGPQDLPWSPALTLRIVIAGVAADGLFAAVGDFDQPFARVLVGLLMLLGMTALLLQLRQRSARFAQTLAALAGTGMLFTLMLLPLSLYAGSLDPAAEPGQLGFGATLSAVLILVLYAWSLMVRAHVLTHALDLPRFAAGIISLCWFVLEVGIGNALFGIPQ